MSETLALLYTDVVDSTLLNSRLGDEPMARQWMAHDAAARELMRTWRGREVGRSDGFLVAFPTAQDAVSFAVAYHRSLALLEPPLQARIGVHVGPVVLRENTAADTEQGATRFDIDGLALPVVARLKSLAIGRQTLLSDAALEALRPTDLRTSRHGYWRIKGLPTPLQITEIGEASAPLVPPPDTAKAYRVVRAGNDWVPVRELPNSLPAERDAFVGRRQEMHTLTELFDNGARLVTLLGIGGIGKTRLSIRYARLWLGDYPGGVWFCDLSAARSSDGIVNAVAQGLDVPLGKSDPIQQLGGAIAGRGECLVILDNFEQVARHAEATLGAWLESASEARFIATSREVLGIVGEHALVLPPLDSGEAVQMFKQRVRAIGVMRNYGPADEGAIAPLVNLLDRLPLAIELAAARARVMSPRLLLQRMSERFKLLATRGGRRDRQATLRATLDWSWDLLSPAEKSALAQLSVFEGGFTLEAAEAVLDGSSLQSSGDKAAVIQALLEKSLVLQRTDERFDLLSAVQEYATEQLKSSKLGLDATKDAQTQTYDRHGDYFAELVRREAPEAVCSDLANLVAAARRAGAAGRVSAAVGSLEGACAGFKLRGPFEAVIELSEVVRATPGLDVAARARVNRVAGWALKACGRVAEAEERLCASVREAKESGARECEAMALINLGDLRVSAGRIEEGREILSTALAIARQLRSAALECEVCSSLGNLCINRGDLSEAEEFFQAALAAARRAKDRRWEGGTLGNLGVLSFEQGRTSDALRNYEEALAVARELGDRQFEGNTLCNLGLLHQGQGQLQLAATELKEALLVARELGHARLECVVLCNLGLVVETMQEPEAARAHFESALRVACTLGDRRSEGQVLNYLGVLHSRQGRFDEGRTCLTQAETHFTQLTDRINLAMLYCSQAECEFLAGDSATAAAVYARACTLAEELHMKPDSELGNALARVKRIVHATRSQIMRPVTAA